MELKRGAILRCDDDAHRQSKRPTQKSTWGTAGSARKLTELCLLTMASSERDEQLVASTDQVAAQVHRCVQ